MPEQRFLFGAFTLDSARGVLLRAGLPVAIGHRALALLAALAKARRSAHQGRADRRRLARRRGRGKQPVGPGCGAAQGCSAGRRRWRCDRDRRARGLPLRLPVETERCRGITSAARADRGRRSRCCRWSTSARSRPGVFRRRRDRRHHHGPVAVPLVPRGRPRRQLRVQAPPRLDARKWRQAGRALCSKAACAIPRAMRIALHLIEAAGRQPALGRALRLCRAGHLCGAGRHRRTGGGRDRAGTAQAASGRAAAAGLRPCERAGPGLPGYCVCSTR